MQDVFGIQIGMSANDVELLIGSFDLVQVRETHFKCDLVDFVDRGLSLYFNPKTRILETIKCYAPFKHPINGITIGMPLNQVKELLGKPSRINPFPDDDPALIWIYYGNEFGSGLRIDFDKKKNGNVVVMYL